MEALAVGATRPGIVAITHGSTTTLTARMTAPGHARGLWLTEGLGPDRPCVGAGVPTTGAFLRWAGGILSPDLEPAEAVRLLEREAATSPPGANGLLVVPSIRRGQRASRRSIGAAASSPAWRSPMAGATSAGRSSRASRSRSAACSRPRVAAGYPVDHLRAAGGGTANALALQIVSDVTGRSQDVAATPGGAALGAARLAAEAVGLAHADGDWFVADRRIEPAAATAAIYDERYGAYRRLGSRGAAAPAAAPSVAAP